MSVTAAKVRKLRIIKQFELSIIHKGLDTALGDISTKETTSIFGSESRSHSPHEVPPPTLFYTMESHAMNSRYLSSRLMGLRPERDEMAAMMAATHLPMTGMDCNSRLAENNSKSLLFHLSPAEPKRINHST
jgi:hypothetical protein